MLDILTLRKLKQESHFKFKGRLDNRTRGAGREGERRETHIGLHCPGGASTSSLHILPCLHRVSRLFVNPWPSILHGVVGGWFKAKE